VATIILDGAKSENLRKSIDEVIGEMGKGESLKSTGYRQMEVDEEGNEYVYPISEKRVSSIIKMLSGVINTLNASILNAAMIETQIALSRFIRKKAFTSIRMFLSSL
jgi:hypothetical protein